MPLCVYTLGAAIVECTKHAGIRIGMHAQCSTVGKRTEREVHRVHRVATAAFWRTFHIHEGKISPGWVGGARPPPFITFTINSKVAVYAPAEWADTLTMFRL